MNNVKMGSIKLDESKVCFGEFEEVSRLCAKSILDFAIELGKTKDKIIIGLPGGRSVCKIFSQFRENKNEIWKKIHIFMIDERVADVTSEESNFKLLYDTFLKEMTDSRIIPAENIHPFVFDLKKPDMGAHSYYTEFKKLGGTFDIVLVSSGEDGHIAALYPRHKVLENDNADYLYMKDSPKLPSKRVTASKKIVFDALLSCLIFSGEAKKDAYQNFRDSKVATKDCPAKLVLKSKSYMVFTDIPY